MSRNDDLYEVKNEFQSTNHIKWKNIFSAIIVVALVFVLLLACIYISKHAISGQTVNTPPYLFYSKHNGVYSTLIDDIKPRKVISDFKDELKKDAPIVLSDDGKWLFYPQIHSNATDLYAYRLDSDNEEPFMLASEVGMFTTNADTSKMYYLQKHKLYAGNMGKFEYIASSVNRYFLNETCDRIVYITNNQILYEKKWNKRPKKMDEKVQLQYVSPDLDTIYYWKEEALYCIKDGKSPKKITDGFAHLYLIYENGDSYYKVDDTLYFYTQGESRLVGDNCSNNVYFNYDYKYYYPYRKFYGGTNPPLIMYEDWNQNSYICKGPEVLKKITGGTLASAVFTQNGDGLYYMLYQDSENIVRDLFYVEIKDTAVSDSKKIDTDVHFVSHNIGDTYVYFKSKDAFAGDMFINETLIDKNVCHIDLKIADSNKIIYTTHENEYYSELEDTYYVYGTLKQYQNGTTKTIANNVIDYEVIEGKLVYLSIPDLDAKSGTLHLYELSGEDSIIDTEVNSIIRPRTDRDLGGEIDSEYGVGSFYICNRNLSLCSN